MFRREMLVEVVPPGDVVVVVGVAGVGQEQKNLLK